MAYIGREPQIGNFQVCDAISVVNGQAAYTMQVGGANVSPETANHMIVSLNGIIQAPGTSYTVAGSTITFASNLATGDVIDFIHILGSVLDLGVPSDGTVTAAKVANDLISGKTALASTPADTDEFLVSDAGTLKRIDYSHIKGGGKVLQVVSATDTTERSHSSSTYSLASSSLTVDITPSATSSKILVMLSTSYKKNGGSMFITIFRDSTNLGNGNNGFINGDANNVPYPGSIVVLDSPSSTSQLTYQIRTRSGGGDAVDFNEGGSTGSIVAMEIGA
tara:strand:+ start:846 stop:1679 length:834 start_codon:yes stop_codon:yes gene_type:complete